MRHPDSTDAAADQDIVEPQIILAEAADWLPHFLVPVKQTDFSLLNNVAQSLVRHLSSRQARNHI